MCVDVNESTLDYLEEEADFIYPNERRLKLRSAFMISLIYQDSNPAGVILMRIMSLYMAVSRSMV